MCLSSLPYVLFVGLLILEAVNNAAEEMQHHQKSKGAASVRKGEDQLTAFLTSD